MSTCILAVDTATEICGVALAVDDQIKTELTLSQGVTHTQSIMAAIESVLVMNRMDVGAIDVYAVTRGPGSFTGLRIGVSTVKGLALATAKPMLGISSLEVLANQAPAASDLICPIMDARRNEVYWALYKRTGADKISVALAEQVGPVSALVESVENACYFIGNGVTQYRDTINHLIKAPAQWAADESNGIRPSVLARLAWQRVRNGEIDDIRAFSPVYLRKSDAEIARQG
ncbi:MAG: tRNA (adenosine(37)-N6)-threonylcarbamoyltransferase complex dimerization subunit type 1 TsaB [Desulfobacteraceae bacterium]|jgi:tRNA threonylcarbamoyladenosine biosynthesis protein TsaB